VIADPNLAIGYCKNHRQRPKTSGSLNESLLSANLYLQVEETGIAGAEGATAPETLRQKDRLPRNTLKSGAYILLPPTV
jgi:hypothetical protein